MNAFETVCLFLGLGLGAWILYHGCHVGWFTVTKKRPAVRVSPEVLAQMRSELIHDASKRIVRADFQRGYRR